MTTPTPGGPPEFITAILNRLQQDKRKAAAQGIAGVSGYAATAVPDLIWDILPQVDPAGVGAYSSVSAIALTALIQGLYPLRHRRKLRLRVLDEPTRLFNVLIADPRTRHLADELVNLLDHYNAGTITKAMLGRRLQEIVTEAVERPEPPTGGQGTA